MNEYTDKEMETIMGACGRKATVVGCLYLTTPNSREFRIHFYKEGGSCGKHSVALYQEHDIVKLLSYWNSKTTEWVYSV